MDKQLRIEYGNKVIASSDIYIESMVISESLCSENSLVFGSCEAGEFKIKLLNNSKYSLMNKTIKVSYIHNDGTKEPLGTYKIVQIKPTSDRKYIEVVGYDYLYSIINTDVIGWYNDLTFPMTMLDFRNSLFEFFNFVQEETELVNDSIVIQKFDGLNVLSGRTVISAICELNGCFGNINRNGRFEYVVLGGTSEAKLPNYDIYPSKNYYPGASLDINGVNKSHYKTCKYEDYYCQYTGVGLRNDEGQLKTYYGNTDNLYLINNFLTYGLNATELRAIAKKIYETIKDVVYIPFKCECIGTTQISIGGAVNIHTNDKVIESYILKREIKGIYAEKDIIESSGEQYFQDKNNGISAEVQQVKNNSAKQEKVLNTAVENLRLAYIEIEKLVAKDAEIESLVALKASIEQLEAVSARVGTLEADHVTTQELSAATARIGSLETNKLDASTVTADYLNSKYLTGTVFGLNGKRYAEMQIIVNTPDGGTKTVSVLGTQD